MKSNLDLIKSEEINALLNLDENLPFKSLFLRTVKRLDDRNFLNIERTEKELEGVDNKDLIEEKYSYDYDDLELYGRLIGDVDQYRSRLSDLLSRAYGDMHFIDEYYSLLEDVWIGKYSKQSSVDKRKGEAKEILAFLLDDKILRKTMHETIKNKFNLMNGKLDALSRKITIKQESLKTYRAQDLDYQTKGPFRSEKKPLKIKENEETTWDSLTEELYEG